MLHEDITVLREPGSGDFFSLWVARLKTEPFAVVHHPFEGVEVLAVLRHEVEMAVYQVIGLAHLV
jgi:hypothetical protein